MAGQPLSPATRHRLGGPLPHQLADTKSPAPRPADLWERDHAAASRHLVLPALSGGYPRVRGTLAIHYSPVRHCRIATAVRLACLNHAASVQAEPGSNSSILFLGPNDPDAPPPVARPRGLTLSTLGIVLEMSLSRPTESRQPGRLLLPRRRLRRRGQSGGGDRRSYPTTTCPMQGSNILFWLTQILDQGRSLTCMHHESV